MATWQKNQRGAGLFNWGRRAQEERLVDQYYAGRLHEPMPIRIGRDAAVAGDIIAPQVVVEGIVYGFIAAREVVVTATGEVWGDVYAISLEIAPRGQLNGWVSSLDEETYNAVQIHPEELPNLFQRNGSSAKALPADLQAAVQEVQRAMPPDRLNILHRLQHQAATALVARAELESLFDERFDELAGETATEAARLRERMALLNTDQAGLRQKMVDLQAQLDVRNAELAQRGQALTAAQQAFERQVEALEELQTTHNLQTQTLLAAQQRIEQLEQMVQDLMRQADETAERIHSLDIALQDSLQRGSEQEEALVRWQELAEVTEKRANEFKTELDSIAFQHRESAQSLSIMRDQRNRLEQEWDKAQDEIARLKKELAQKVEQASASPELVAQVEQLQKELDRKNRELNLTKQAMVEGTGALAQAKRQMEAVENDLNRAREQAAVLELAQEQIGKLKDELSQVNQALNAIQAEHRLLKVDSERRITALQQDNQRARERLPELQGQMTAHQSALQAAEAKLQQATLRESQQEKLIAQIHGELETAKKQAAQARTNQQSAAQAEALQAQLATLKADYELQQRQIKQLKGEAHDGRLRLQALEQDVDTYQEQISHQGRRLAELQNELVDHDLRYKQVLGGARKQAAELQQIKTAAQQRITTLQADLQKARQQVVDLTSLLERYRKK